MNDNTAMSSPLDLNPTMGKNMSTNKKGDKDKKKDKKHIGKNDKGTGPSPSPAPIRGARANTGAAPVAAPAPAAIPAPIPIILSGPVLEHGPTTGKSNVPTELIFNSNMGELTMDMRTGIPTTTDGTKHPLLRPDTKSKYVLLHGEIMEQDKVLELVKGMDSETFLATLKSMKAIDLNGATFDKIGESSWAVPEGHLHDLGTAVLGKDPKCQEEFEKGLNFVPGPSIMMPKMGSDGNGQDNMVSGSGSANEKQKSIPAPTAKGLFTTKHEPGTQQPRIPTGKVYEAKDLKEYKEIHIATFEDKPSYQESSSQHDPPIPQDSCPSPYPSLSTAPAMPSTAEKEQVSKANVGVVRASFDDVKVDLKTGFDRIQKESKSYVSASAATPGSALGSKPYLPVQQQQPVGTGANQQVNTPQSKPFLFGQQQQQPIITAGAQQQVNTSQANPKVKTEPEPAGVAEPLQQVPIPGSYTPARVRQAWDRVVKQHASNLGANAPIYAPSISRLNDACIFYLSLLPLSPPDTASKAIHEDFAAKIIRATSSIWKEVTVWLQAEGYGNRCGLVLMLNAVIYLLKDVEAWVERVPLFRAFNGWFVEEWLENHEFDRVVEFSEEIMGEETGFASAVMLRDSVRTILEMKRIEDENALKETGGVEHIVPECLTHEGKEKKKAKAKAKEAQANMSKGMEKTKAPSAFSQPVMQPEPQLQAELSAIQSILSITNNMDSKPQNTYPTPPPTTSTESSYNPSPTNLPTTPSEMKQLQTSLSLLLSITSDIQSSIHGIRPSDPERAAAVTTLNAKAKETGLLLMNNYLGEWMTETRVLLNRLCDKVSLIETEVVFREDPSLRDLLARIEKRNIKTQILAANAEDKVAKCLAGLGRLEDGKGEWDLNVLTKENDRVKEKNEELVQENELVKEENERVAKQFEDVQKRFTAYVKQVTLLKVWVMNEVKKGGVERDGLEDVLMRILWPQGCGEGDEGEDVDVDVGVGVGEVEDRAVVEILQEIVGRLGGDKVVDAPVAVNQAGRAAGTGWCCVM